MAFNSSNVKTGSAASNVKIGSATSNVETPPMTAGGVSKACWGALLSNAVLAAAGWVTTSGDTSTATELLPVMLGNCIGPTQPTTFQAASPSINPGGGDIANPLLHFLRDDVRN